MRDRSVGVSRPEQSLMTPWLSRLVLLAALVCFVGSVRGQDVASITGTVTDKTGAAVSDAVVKLTNTSTDARFE